MSVTLVTVNSADKLGLVDEVVKCELQPIWVKLDLPEQGFKDLDDDKKKNNICKIDHDWQEFKFAGQKYYSGVSGPEGSGRYWNITIGVSELNRKNPTRGLCFVVSTIGWRTLQRYPRLQWMTDLDDDGTPEFIIWNSFYLDDSLQAQRSGISVWVYKILGEQLILDSSLTRKLSLKLSKAYLKSLPRANSSLYRSRRKISRILSGIAKSKCKF